MPGSVDGFVIETKIASILWHPLVIEADAARGGSYRTNTTHGSGIGKNDECGSGGKVIEGGNVLYIYIPYFRTVKIERGSVSRSLTIGAPRVLEARTSTSDPAISFREPLHERDGKSARELLSNTISPAGYN